MIERLVRQVGENPKLDSWDPPLCGDIDIEIDREGNWYCQGEPFRRPALVQLFASVLRAESDGHHYLVTPVEKWRVRVQDAPFLLTELESDDGQWWLNGPNGVRCPVSDDHPWLLKQGIPYVRLWHGMLGKISRALYYRLAEQAECRDGEYGVQLGAQWCVLGEKE
ncbi:DUF1285 domain-containing protein [Ferrimonas balearica]|uniref:DUF1285 domain-containing protein n=1 Tax=Ferrimonas balearica TaxID=44012 RepID=UPI001C9939C8|nr:DUF1285 domain-containing protein [Ferrimonas balearica]MBY5920123.1 DUF1285 domain-containing protein [Ferrimonas balearica]MBY5997192.1 DUF1285 domain-containing protein [Ferrimonas balearica]